MIGYDGTDFLGYQLQAQGRTVQGELEHALKRITHTDIRVDGAGRTDTGVHATGQVIAFNAAWRHTPTDLQRALNANLPDDIIASTLEPAPDSFHPRFDAIRRQYRYTIINQPWPDVLQRRYAYHIRMPLDVRAMQAACQALVGHHDFAAFGKAPQGNNTVRHLMQAAWQVEESHLNFYITANAFLYRMVRRVVGTLVQVGLGQLTPSDVAAIREAKVLDKTIALAPPHGLCLVAVTYPRSVTQ